MSVPSHYRNPNLYVRGVSLCTALRRKHVPASTALPAFRLPLEQMSVLLTKRCSGDELKKDEMDGAWGMNGPEKRCIENFGGDV